MTEPEADLYRRIESYSIDAPGATYTFAQRLAKENRWSPAFVDRAILEYRRFTFLFAAAGHPVSPPEVIDQVWHLHLLYTKSYWRDFCQSVLGKPLHHEPSTGGAEERAKFDEWYASTRESYRRYFGEPPADIWPDPVTKAADGNRYQRVDLSRHWIVGRRKVRSIVRVTAAVVLLLGIVFLASGCDEATMKEWNPLEFRGPKFLLFYGVSFAAACVLARVIRSDVQEPYELSIVPGDFEPYEIAYLNGGSRQVIHAAIAALCHRGWVKASSGGKLRRLKQDPALKPADMHAVEWAVLSAVGGGWPGVGRVREKSAATAGGLRDRLVQSGLIVSDGKNAWTVWRSLIVVLSVPALGIIKIAVGVQRNRPVGFLVLWCFLSLVIGIVFFARRVHRTRQGDSMLDQLRNQHRGLQKAKSWTDETLVTAVGLWGESVLSGSEWSPLRAALAYKPLGTSGSDSGCGGSSCGGSGCGGGGGGGGCGGCSS